jgi:hypothetical protein
LLLEGTNFLPSDGLQFPSCTSFVESVPSRKTSREGERNISDAHRGKLPFFPASPPYDRVKVRLMALNLQKLTIFFSNLGGKQGDQIGRFFASCVIAYFG